MAKKSTPAKKKLKIPILKSSKRLSIVLVSIAAIIIAVSGWLAMTKISHEPKRVFWTMINNNFKTSSVTRNGTQKTPQGSIEQHARLSFGPTTGIHAVTTLNQLNEDGSRSKVTIETIGTLTDDFIRYKEISAGQGSPQKLNLDKVLNIWGRQAPETPDSKGKFFSEALLGVVPFGNFPLAQRDALTHDLQYKHVYTPDFNAVKTTTKGGRRAYVYPVKVNIGQLIEFIQDYRVALGLGRQNGLKGEDYKDQPFLQLELAVDVTSQQLVSINFLGEDRLEVYDGYGLKAGFQKPKDTIAVKELQARLSQVR